MDHLSSSTWDIIHLGMYVEPASGAFNRAQLYTDPGLLLLAKRDFRLTASSAAPCGVAVVRTGRKLSL